MAHNVGGDGGLLHHFSLPLPSLGIQICATPDDLADAAKEALETEATWGLGESGERHLSEFSIAQVGSLLITSGRTTPVALQYKPSEQLIVELCYGGSSRFKDGATDLRTVFGEILAFPAAAGTLCGGFHSGISFRLERERLTRTARAMLGHDCFPPLRAPCILKGHADGAPGPRRGLLFSLFRHLDRVFWEDPYLPSRLELDDQIYRTFVHEVTREYQLESLPGRDAKGPGWSVMLDDLVDYIRANSHRRLSLTDLEERSHYSARHLQNLFKQKFDCTPMQFVRRQRLAVAMQKLQSSDCQQSVTQIARDCGYRYVSNFSTDFQRQFGINPSLVLRTSRRGAPRALSDPVR